MIMAAAIGSASVSGEKESFEVRDSIAAFGSYEEYLDSQVSDLDLFYLEDEDVARLDLSKNQSAF